MSRRRLLFLRRLALLSSLVLPIATPAHAAEVTFERLVNADREPQNWLMNHRTYDAQRYSPLARINRSNVKNLRLFVDDEVLRERLKEAKGIGTPATRAEIIGGLKRQGFLMAQAKHIVPTETGLSLFGVLKQADPALVAPRRDRAT